MPNAVPPSAHQNVRRIRTFTIALATLLAGFAWGAESIRYTVLDTKLDAPLHAFAVQPETALSFYGEHVKFAAGAKRTATAAVLPVLIRLGDGADEAATLAALRAAGVQVHSRLGPIATAEVPVAALGALAALEGIASIELAHTMVPKLNVSVPYTGAATLRTGTPPNWAGLTGKGVIVGIIDDGIDFRHRDFRNVDGSTRLLGLWDQRATGAAGTPPAGQNYGGECTPLMLNAAIAGDATACTQPSSGGHGTHVGGIAAGNGSATGNGQPAYRFIGMAPEADILVANALGAGGRNTIIVDAIAWMKARASAAGKPLAINMSFGNYYGARDGTSNYEVALAAAGGPGVVLAAAAGNEGNAPLRASGPLAQDGTLTFDVNVPAGSTGVALEAWYPGTDRYNVTFQGPGCDVTPPFVATLAIGKLQTPCGQVGGANGGPFAANDDRQLQAVMQNGDSPLAAGVWRITVIGAQVAAGTATVSVVTANDGGGMTIVAVNGQPPPPLTTQILTDTAGARRVIGVAALNTNYSWQTAQGPSSGNPIAGPVGDLSDFSSRGPRRLCSNPVKCPQVMKPDITAPGTSIMSALAADAANTDPMTVELDGVHVTHVGTSMATPHVTGAIALLLQKNPTLTPEDVKQLLLTNFQRTAFTPAALPAYTGADVPANPNIDWGYGILDVAAAAGATALPGGSPVLTAFEFLNTTQNRYFLTIDAGEAAGIDAGAAGPGWLRTGYTFRAYSISGTVPSSAVPVCRFYGSVTPGPNSHFFTANAAECQALKDIQASTPATQPRWNYEGIAFRTSEPAAGGICATGLTPVLRAYNRGNVLGIDSNHRFTTSLGEIQRMVLQGWSNEGVVFCAPN